MVWVMRYWLLCVNIIYLIIISNLSSLKEKWSVSNNLFVVYEISLAYNLFYFIQTSVIKRLIPCYNNYLKVRPTNQLWILHCQWCTIIQAIYDQHVFPHSKPTGITCYCSSSTWGEYLGPKGWEWVVEKASQWDFL